MPLNKRKVEKGLSSKGFTQDEKKHECFLYTTLDGKRAPIKTWTSRGAQKYKELGDDLVSYMSKQCKLSKAEFVDLISCPMSQSQYEEILADKGFI